jgi:hypothetical protein
LHYGVGGTRIPKCVPRLLWQRCYSHCRRLKAPQIRRVAAAVVQERVRAGGFADAIAIVERATEAMSPNRQRDLFEHSYDRWAKTFIDKTLWDDAIRIYDQGLTRLPNNSLFTRNRAYCLAHRK